MSRLERRRKSRARLFRTLPICTYLSSSTAQKYRPGHLWDRGADSPAGRPIEEVKHDRANAGREETCPSIRVPLEVRPNNLGGEEHAANRRGEADRHPRGAGREHHPVVRGGVTEDVA